MSDQARPEPSHRREFLKSSSALVVGGSLAATLGTARSVHAAGSDVIRIGLIGCGGRGSGAAGNALKAGKEGGDLKRELLADAEMRRYLSAQEIDNLWDIKHHLANIDVIFRRVFR